MSKSNVADRCDYQKGDGTFTLAIIGVLALFYLLVDSGVPKQYAYFGSISLLCCIVFAPKKKRRKKSRK